jgi:glc operon protein GlcG
MRKRMTIVLVLLALAQGAWAQTVVDRKALTLAGAQGVVEVALAAAKVNQLRQSIAVLDEGGNLVAFARMDDAQLAGVQMAIGKARTALMFQDPSKDFADRIAAGQLNVLALPGMLPADGGQPLIYDGKIIGAVGVSGASPTQDGQTALKAAASLH